MPQFPTGVVTLVFTDIEGSSALWETHHQAFTPVLEAHNRILRSAAALWQGVEVKTEGDAFFLAFERASDAVQFAVEAQRSLLDFGWEEVLVGLKELRVRIGMHTGEPILLAHPDGTADYFGPAVNRAARVGGAGYGGQILVSDATKTHFAGGEIGFENLGQHRLKGVGEETLYQVVFQGLPSRFPALKTLVGAKHNLPLSQTPFIGRETEIMEWSAWLRKPDVRLLTLCGFGGQGKTRLALQIAENLVENFEDGVWWVELEAARDADAMVARIAHELRLHLQPQPTVREQVFEFHRERELLLVLDNTEQIPDAGAVVNGLLAVAPRLKCLVTTRRALEIRAERVAQVPPLPVSDAVALFVERAASRVADFSLDLENRAAIEELCGALEGVPLAIELAASRLAILSPREMIERLDERLRLLQTRAPDLPPRQRALRGAIDWSYELLGAEEKSLLSELSVFAGGFSLGAAERVSEDFDVLEGVAELARHSFLRSEENGGRKRFAMSESVRAYAAEKGGDLPNFAGVRKRHVLYFLDFAEKNVRKLRTRDEFAALEAAWSERANLLAALDFASETEAAMSSRLALALHDLVYRLGFWDEARAALQKVENLSRLDAQTSGAIHLRLASLAHDGGKSDEAEKRARIALDLAQTAGDARGEADALNLLGLLALDSESMDEAGEFFEKSLSGRAPSDFNGRAIALHNLALLASRQREIESATNYYEAALDQRRAAGDARGEAETLGNLGVLAHTSGDLEGAVKLYRQSLDLRHALRDRMGVGLMLHNLGEIAALKGDFARATALFVHSERTFREIGSPFSATTQKELENLKESLGADFESRLSQSVESNWQNWI
jgi:predicted ATPase/class 3 adenylate cyclase